MNAAGEGSRPAPSPEIVALARRLIARELPPFVGRAPQIADAQSDFLATMIGAGIVFWRMLRDARATSGRDLIAAVYALNALMGVGEGPKGIPHERDLRLFAPWLGRLRGPDPLRGALLGWIDLFNERLTMHRYSGRAHRLAQAHRLIALPLLASGFKTPDPAQLDTVADWALALWDLNHAAGHRQHGWNRIAFAENESMGGFYGLADQAAPVEPADIRRAAEALLAEIRRTSPERDAPLDAIVAMLSAELEKLLADAAWPADPQGLAARLAGWLRTRLGG